MRLLPRSRRGSWLLAGAVVVASGLLLGWWGNTEAGRRARIYDEPFDDVIVRSTDLSADLKKMWRVVPDSQFGVAPVSAINAASRVFETVDLRGMTLGDVRSALRFQERNGYGYNFSFSGPKPSKLVFRFDCGAFGWEFELILDAQGRVQSVTRMGIE
jgi:hypothetical protein